MSGIMTASTLWSTGSVVVRPTKRIVSGVLRSPMHQPPPLRLVHSKYNRVELSLFAGYGDCISCRAAGQRRKRCGVAPMEPQRGPAVGCQAQASLGSWRERFPAQRRERSSGVGMSPNPKPSVALCLRGQVLRAPGSRRSSGVERSCSWFSSPISSSSVLSVYSVVRILRGLQASGIRHQTAKSGIRNLIPT